MPPHVQCTYFLFFTLAFTKLELVKCFTRPVHPIFHLKNQAHSFLPITSSKRNDRNNPTHLLLRSDSSENKFPSSSKASKVTSSLMDQAMELKRQAEKARLEAEQADIKFTLTKISDLESKLDILQKDVSNGVKEDEKRKQLREDLTKQLEQLKDKLVEDSLKSSETMQDPEVVTSSSKNIENDKNDNVEEDEPTNADLNKKDSSIPIQKSLNNTVEAINEYNVDDNSNEVSIENSLSSETIADAVEGFDNLPTMIQDMIAKSVGMPDGKNTTMVIETLLEQGKMKLVLEDETMQGMNDTDNKTDENDLGIPVFEIDSIVDGEDVISLYMEDLENADRDRYVEAILPKSTRKYEIEPVEEDIEVLYQKVLDMKTFNPSSKAEDIPGAFIIRGENRLDTGYSLSIEEKERNSPNDKLIIALDKRIANNATGIADKLLCCYIMDPTPFEEPEFDVGQDLEEPVLVIFGKDMNPEINPIVATSATITGLGSVAIFAIGAFSFNGLSEQLQDPETVIYTLKEIVSPLVLYILGIQFVHELGHRLIAFRDKIDIGLPIIVPSFQTGLTGCITKLKSPPKNFSSLFDFALAGPLLGMIASVSSLFIGLEETVRAYSYSNGNVNTALSSFPALPIDFLRLSSLGGGIVEFVLGDSVLISTDPANTSIALHPLAVAGYIGILVNALSLVPIGSTDGGRMSLALFGRPLNRFVQAFTIFFLVAIGFFGLDESNVLLTYVIFTFWTQRENEIPCRNEVDDIDFGRVLTAIGSLSLVVLSLTPLP